MLRKGIPSILLALALASFGVQYGKAETVGGAAESYWDEDVSGADILAGRLAASPRVGLLRLLIGSCTGMGEHSYIEGRLAFLRAELGIQDPQKNAWNNFSDAVRHHLANVKASIQAARTAAAEDKAPGERLENRISTLENRLKSLKELKPAFNTLYDSLNPEQRSKADELVGSVGCIR